MNEQGIYLLAQGSQPPDADSAVLVWAVDGQVSRARLGAVGPILATVPVVLIMPMEMLGCCQAAALPGRRPSRQALGYTVEDQLAAPLEVMHLAYSAPDRQGLRRTLVIERERLQQVLKVLQGQGIDPVRVHVDADLLFTRAGALWLEGRWLLGGAHSPLLAVPAAAAEAMAAVLEPMPWQAEADHAVPPCNQAIDSAIALLINARADAIDLRQGAFRRRRGRLPWRLPVLVLMLVGVLAGAADRLRAGWLEQQATSLRAQNVERFQRWATDQPVPGDLASQVNALQARPLPTTAVERLGVLAEQIVEAGNLTLSSAELDVAQAWHVQAVAQRFDDLERLRHSLPGLAMEHARQAPQGVQATLVWAGAQ